MVWGPRHGETKINLVKRENLKMKIETYNAWLNGRRDGGGNIKSHWMVRAWKREEPLIIDAKSRREAYLIGYLGARGPIHNIGLISAFWRQYPK